MPSAYDSFTEAEQEICFALKKAKQNKINIVAVAIDEDEDIIKELYKSQKFLGISDLDLLAKRLYKIIEKFL